MTNSEILEQAAEWCVTLRERGDAAAAREEFAAWLCKSPEHVRAYLELAALWTDVARADVLAGLDAATLVDHAMAESNVVPLGVAQRQEPQPALAPPGRRQTKRRALLAAALATLAIAAGGWLWQAQRYPTYVATIGEQRSIVLEDGSVVELNSRSRVRVRFTERERTIDLLEGQGLFRVARAPDRPFIVRSGDVLVRAVGTEFDVYRRPAGTTVTVLEGKVDVIASSRALVAAPREDEQARPADASRVERRTPTVQPIRLAAGEQAIVSRAGTVEPKPANVAAATAWMQRQLVFDSAPLEEVAHEFNRYNERRLVIRDERLRGVLISGVFSSTDPAALLRFLHEQSDLEVEETDSEVHVLARAP
ncbi:MAG: FecR family protein [Steroidobacter sp.]